MRRGLIIVAQVFSALLVLVAGLVLFVPSERVERSGPFTGDLSDPEAYLAAREAAYDDIVAGTEARIVWAAENGEPTEVSVLFLHGFSATSEEIRPVPDNVAEALGANLVFARLRGHGRTGQTLAEATSGQWLDDTAEALAIARAVGDQVIVIGVSTGATMAAIAATEPDVAEGIAGIVMISPNFRLANPLGRLLDAPGASVWIPWVFGAERGWEPENADHGRYWTNRYPSVTPLSMAAAMREARRRDFSDIHSPLLMIYAQEDQVVSAEAALAALGTWGGPAEFSRQELPDSGVDPYAHVIAGDILSPAMTDEVTGQIVTWAEGVVSLN